MSPRWLFIGKPVVGRLLQVAGPTYVRYRECFRVAGVRLTMTCPNYRHFVV